MEKWQETLEQKMVNMKTLTVDVEEKTFDKNERSVKHWVSKKSLDRGGDIVEPESLDSTSYKKNPIVLFNHNVYMPVARSLWLKPESDGVLAKTVFGTTPFADDIYTLNVERILNAWSIGFIPKTWEFDEKSKVTTFTAAELLEYSNVSIPMNQDAVTEGLKMVKSEFVKNLLSETKESIESKIIIASMQSDIQTLKEQYDKLTEHSQSDLIKDVEEIEKELLEIKKQINYIAGTSGNQKVFSEMLKMVSGDVSGK